MKKYKTKLNLKAEEYSYTTKERDWGSCQENDTSDDAYYNVSKKDFIVRLGDHVVAKGFSSLEAAKSFIKCVNRNDKELKAVKRSLRKMLEQDLKKLKVLAEKELDKWFVAQHSRKKTVSKGEEIYPHERDLTSILDINLKIERLSLQGEIKAP